MNTFKVVALCFQVCLIQSAYSQCAGPYRPGPGFGPAMGPGFSSPPLGPGFANPALGYGPIGYGLDAPAPGYGGPALGYGFDSVCPYGGSGVGNVAVAGELPVGGTAIVGGQVPIIGAVDFGGPAAAAGAVVITGSCGCSCSGAPYAY